MSQVKKRFEYTSEYHRTKETLKANDLGHGVYIGVNSEVELPFNELDEQTTSIVLPKSEIPAFILFLQEIVQDEA